MVWSVVSRALHLHEICINSYSLGCSNGWNVACTFASVSPLAVRYCMAYTEYTSYVIMEYSFEMYVSVNGIMTLNH